MKVDSARGRAYGAIRSVVDRRPVGEDPADLQNRSDNLIDALLAPPAPADWPDRSVPMGY